MHSHYLLKYRILEYITINVSCISMALLRYEGRTFMVKEGCDCVVQSFKASG